MWAQLTLIPQNWISGYAIVWTVPRALQAEWDLTDFSVIPRRRRRRRVLTGLLQLSTTSSLVIDWLIDYDSVVTMSHAWDYLQYMLMSKLWCGHSSVVDTSQPIDPIPAACCRLGDFPAGLRQQRPIGLRIIRRLQSAINAVDRMVYNIRRNSDTFICFHWYQRIQFKTAAVLLVVLCRPFSDVVAEQAGRRSVRSCWISSHVVSAFHRPTVGDRSLPVVDPQTWTKLDVEQFATRWMSHRRLHSTPVVPQPGEIAPFHPVLSQFGCNNRATHLSVWSA